MGFILCGHANDPSINLTEPVPEQIKYNCNRTKPNTSGGKPSEGFPPYNSSAPL